MAANRFTTFCADIKQLYFKVPHPNFRVPPTLAMLSIGEFRNFGKLPSAELGGYESDAVTISI